MTRRIAVSGLLLALLVVPAFAQRGTSGSQSTSLAPPASLLTGGTHLPPAAPSITSRGFGRIDNGVRFNGVHHPGVGVPLRGTDFHRNRDHDRRHRLFNSYYPAYYYPYYGYGYGYGYGGGPVYMDDYSDLPGAGTFNTQQAVEEDDREAPTVFENRRPSEMFYRPNAGANSVLDRDRYGDHYTDNRERTGAPEAESRGVVTTNGNENNDTTTVLVFKDGMQREVTNYAIMGQYIFVFSGDRRKIPLSEIDLEATKKLNEDRGNEFKIPSSSKAS